VELVPRIGVVFVLRRGEGVFDVTSGETGLFEDIRLVFSKGVNTTAGDGKRSCGEAAGVG